MTKKVRNYVRIKPGDDCPYCKRKLHDEFFENQRRRYVANANKNNPKIQEKRRLNPRIDDALIKELHSRYYSVPQIKHITGYSESSIRRAIKLF